MKKLLRAGALAALAAVGAIGGVANAAVPRQAQTPQAAPNSQPRPIRVAGRVDSVSGSGLVLTTGRNRTVHVNVGTNTWILVPGTGQRCAEGTLSSLQTGKPTEVLGMSTSVANTVDARAIAQGACARELNGRLAKQAARALEKHAAAGTVKSIDGTSLTITNANGKDIAVNTTSNTVVFNNGFAAVSSIKAGDKVQIFGRRTTAGSGTSAPAAITAWAIHDQNAGTRVTLARVSKVDASTVTLRNGRTVILDSSAAYKTLQVTSQGFTLAPASLSDVKAGSNLALEVTVSQDGRTITAKAVVILPLGKAPALKP